MRNFGFSLGMVGVRVSPGRVSTHGFAALILLAGLALASPGNAGETHTLAALIPGTQLTDQELGELYGRGTPGGVTSASVGSKSLADVLSNNANRSPRRTLTPERIRPVRGGAVGLASRALRSGSPARLLRSPRTTRAPERPRVDVRLDPRIGPHLAESLGLSYSIR